MKRQIGNKARVFQILDAIYEIESYVGNASYDDFINHSMMRIATVKQLEILGAAARNVTEELREEQPEIPWVLLASFERVLVHEYFGINYEIVWRTAKEEIPELKREVEKLIKKIGEEEF